MQQNLLLLNNSEDRGRFSADSRLCVLKNGERSDGSDQVNQLPRLRVATERQRERQIISCAICAGLLFAERPRCCTWLGDLRGFERPRTAHRLEPTWVTRCRKFLDAIPVRIS